ncbi:acyltransferase ChoActase/COT/CPT [Dichotomocladium elegans]|nr:acyltransferase ChoActase/COT/CPT [Dichotomocladium elegans]
MANTTFSLQHTLPRLPVPSLKESCAVYLQSLKPLLTPEAYIEAEKKVIDFATGPLGKSLQQRLLDIEATSPYNWLEDNFWLKKAYLEWREPLMVNSNWYILGKNDPNTPPSLLSNRPPAGVFTHFQIHRAAHLTVRCLDYKEIIEKEAIPVEKIKGRPQCMWQHSRIFALTRIPMYHCDSIVQYDISVSRHIVVFVRDQVYRVPVYIQTEKGWRHMTLAEMERALFAVVHHVLRLKEADRQAPIGLLSSWDRDQWTVARNHLLALDPINQATSREIESALFALCLDDYTNGYDSKSRSQMGFCGHLGLGGAGHNRWYDKSFTLAVENSGQAIVMGEHSPCDALLVSYVWDHMLDVPCPEPFDASRVEPIMTEGEAAHLLQWRSDAFINTCLENAQKAANETLAFSDSYVEIFDVFGTDWIKKVARVSPDAFLQMVLQISYFRAHKKITPTYETGSTRKYLHGRTDTIRTCSIDSKKLCEGWDDPTLDAHAKYKLLQTATTSHSKYTRLASEGRACDRHLMVLRLLNADHQILSPTTGKLEPAPMHPMFEDPIYRASQTWRLSTSGLQAGLRLMGTGFGAVVPDGYGINYMAAPGLVKFGIECKRVPETLTAEQFGKTIRQTLLDLKHVCEQINPPSGQAKM